jgi:hypothetical protein
LCLQLVVGNALRLIEFLGKMLGMAWYEGGWVGGKCACWLDFGWQGQQSLPLWTAGQAL